MLKINFYAIFGRMFSILSAHSVKTIFWDWKLFLPSLNLKSLFRYGFYKRQNDKKFSNRFRHSFPNFDFLKIIKVGLFSLSRPAPPQMTGQKSSSRFPVAIKPKPTLCFRRAFQQISLKPCILWLFQIIETNFSFVLIISFFFYFCDLFSQKRQVVFNRFHKISSSTL